VPTILDVARLAGVSPTTAKRALRTPELLQPKTLERVKHAIAQLEYEPDETAASLRRGKNRTVGLVVGSIVEPFFAQLARTIAESIRPLGYALILADSDYKSDLEMEALKQMHGNRVSGLIIRSGYGKSTLEYLERMRRSGTFILEIDYRHEDGPFSWVLLDNRRCLFEGVHYLADLGHTRIAAIGAYDPLMHNEERTKYFTEAMKAHNLSIPQEYVRVIALNEREAYDLTLYLMQLPKPPTALFAFNGSSALGAYRALRELELHIPRDVSLLSFDNYTWTSLVNPALDVFEQPVEDMARAAARMVLAAVAEGAPAEPVRLTFPARLLKRGSCAAPNPSHSEH
jgi:LacI family transcriptional regulator